MIKRCWTSFIDYILLEIGGFTFQPTVNIQMSTIVQPFWLNFSNAYIKQNS